MKDYDIKLYQFEACPFCCKVKAYLDYKKLPYQVVEVNPLNKKEISFSDYKKVPILIINGEQINDSSNIIDKLEEITGKISDSTENEKKWRSWLDNDFVHILAPNIYSTMQESLQSFDYITKVSKFSPLQKHFIKLSGATAMYFVAKKLKEKHNIKEPRKLLYEKINYWLENLNGKFMGGEKPNIADLTLFGYLRSIENLRTFYDLRINTDIDKWYLPMKEFVTSSLVGKS
jgi:microsomal prostaglandin-E synthase 2